MFWATVKLLQRSGAKVQISVSDLGEKGHRAIIFIYLGRMLPKPSRNPKETSRPARLFISQAQPKPKRNKPKSIFKTQPKITTNPQNLAQAIFFFFSFLFFPSFLPSPIVSSSFFLGQLRKLQLAATAAVAGDLSGHQNFSKYTSPLHFSRRFHFRY